MKQTLSRVQPLSVSSTNSVRWSLPGLNPGSILAVITINTQSTVPSEQGVMFDLLSNLILYQQIKFNIECCWLLGGGSVRQAWSPGWTSSGWVLDTESLESSQWERELWSAQHWHSHAQCDPGAVLSHLYSNHVNNMNLLSSTYLFRQRSEAVQSSAS